MINKELLDEIKEYCELNDISLEESVNKALRGGFTTLKFGATPMSSKKERKPVEVIKTVEKVVEKIVKVSDDTKVNELLEEMDKLSKNFDINKKILIKTEEDYDKAVKALKIELKKCEADNKKDIYGE
jgi:hypothetical protein